MLSNIALSNTRCLQVALLCTAALAGSGCNRQPDAPASKQADNSGQNPALTKTIPLKLGKLSDCQQYSGLPPDWLTSKTAGMAYIPTGAFNIGSTQGYADELPLKSGQKTAVKAFWIDQTEVTNAQFAAFVNATRYVTDAEKEGGAAVFIAPKASETIRNNSWWHYVKGADWQHPSGPDSSIKDKGHEPVILVTKNDAEHYAVWLERDLPTEAQWEYAAKAGADRAAQEHASQDHAPHDAHGAPSANYWQGTFPVQNDKTDHFAGIAPVGCYKPNSHGLYDMIGNVWEWTQTAYTASHDEKQQKEHLNHGGDAASALNRPAQNATFSTPVNVIKGGSYLCAANYCVRYRAAARYPQEADLATNHVGFRTVLNLN